MVEAEKLERHAIEARSTYTSSKNPQCAALFHDQTCRPIKDIPSCVNGTFPGRFFTLSKQSALAFQQSPWFQSSNFNDTLFSSLPQYDFLGGTFNFSNPVNSCAVVSSSASLLNTKQGAHIDQHDVVLRFNNAVTKGFEQDVGSKTTLRITNGIYEGFREGSEAVIARWCSKAPCDGALHKLWRLSAKKVHGFHPAYHEYVSSLYFRQRQHLPTAGFAGVLLLLHVCANVKLFGFDLNIEDEATSSNSGHNLKEWYYAKRPLLNKRGLPKRPRIHGKKINMKDQMWEVGSWSYACQTPDADVKGHTHTCGNTSMLRMQSSPLSLPSEKEDAGEVRLGMHAKGRAKENL
ncbi:hypothetical protein CYMTET_39446 [Cymbomonas tetramitiformis]|uniref:beta-galactoside alpha-(2,6)-sialyltransferase n=1 Tax=Cymbomonas tetramitiformis TaxID=36881 RepID=A0AAE0CA16_9CHLO|nr:hypothetical protein CYMTET_39446 [Cymbomonas tetramitiformis]